MFDCLGFVLTRKVQDRYSLGSKEWTYCSDSSQSMLSCMEELQPLLP